MIAVVGDGGVGKTALAVQSYDLTIKDAYRKNDIVDSRLCLVKVIDTTRQKGQAFILVYIKMFDDTLKKMNTQDLSFILVGIKCDKDIECEVTELEGANLAREFQCESIETLAQMSLNVDLVFREKEICIVTQSRQKK
ncbi:hypothetical protein K435DRAFT_822221 [Dendrothele bispora CBS 962.96]|uniref:Ras-domain-containing protein n=1 Tax=Dendrothele bispora (strain CBS 962.96) TaxID=1314807 RepID=A0A4S8LBF5_DENBC|nr:hypothetical protein K435DRAFT_822221 [Dendrothele bispora CBS 962.96]